MRNYPDTLAQMKPNWITRLLFAAATLTLVVLGVFFLTVALAVGAVVATVIGLRFWWTLRKLKRAHQSIDPAHATHGDTVVDGEYRVIEHERQAPPLIEAGAPAPTSHNTPPAA